MIETKIIPCSCLNPEHHVLYVKEDKEPCVYIYTQLNVEFPWYKRITLGLRYIFGLRNKFGMYNEVIIDESNYYHLKRIINHIDIFK